MPTFKEALVATTIIVCLGLTLGVLLQETVTMPFADSLRVGFAGEVGGNSAETSPLENMPPLVGAIGATIFHLLPAIVSLPITLLILNFRRKQTRRSRPAI